jgi:hypothetical protein
MKGLFSLIEMCSLLILHGRAAENYSHHFDVFFLCGPAPINFTFGFHAYFDYNRLPKGTRKTLFNIRALSLFRYSACFASLG